jgi:hypothetical protein
MEVKEQCQVEVSAWEKVDDDDDDVISRAWEGIREDIKVAAADGIGYYDLKQHKIWVAEECLKLLDQREQAKFH